MTYSVFLIHTRYTQDIHMIHTSHTHDTQTRYTQDTHTRYTQDIHTRYTHKIHTRYTHKIHTSLLDTHKTDLEQMASVLHCVAVRAVRSSVLQYIIVCC